MSKEVTIEEIIESKDYADSITLDCPKCGSDDTTVIGHSVNYCNNCEYMFSITHLAVMRLREGKGEYKK